VFEDANSVAGPDKPGITKAAILPSWDIAFQPDPRVETSFD